MDYKEALAYISGMEFFGSKPGLSRIGELLEKLGDPRRGCALSTSRARTAKGAAPP